MIRTRSLRLAALPLLLAASASAQQPQQPAATPPAREADVESIDAIIRALYDVISGPVGAPRDWDRMRSLFAPDGRLIPTGQRPDGTGVYRTLSVEDYVRTNGPALIELGFREHEIGRVTERFGSIAHAFSSYEAFRGGEADPFMKGINSIQLWHDGARWWILSVYWQQASERVPLPLRYGGTNVSGGGT